MNGIEKLRKFSQKEPHLYGAIFSLAIIVMYTFFMVGDMAIKGKTDLNPLYVVPLLFFGAYSIYKHLTK